MQARGQNIFSGRIQERVERRQDTEDRRQEVVCWGLDSLRDLGVTGNERREGRMRWRCALSFPFAAGFCLVLHAYFFWAAL